ncbi:MAG: hypothetical protein VYE77_05775, partial [Planctomycetota bacterium]|nr:hypothetical protein [Planctomycetota bacterium]
MSPSDPHDVSDPADQAGEPQAESSGAGSAPTTQADPQVAAKPENGPAEAGSAVASEPTPKPSEAPGVAGSSAESGSDAAVDGGGPAGEAPAPAAEQDPKPDGPPAGEGAADGAAPERKRRRRRRGKKGPKDQAGDPVAGGGREKAGRASSGRGSSGRGGEAGRDGGRDAKGRRGRAPKTAHHALAALRSLSRMAQALLKVEGVDPLSVPRYLDLNLRVPLEEQADARGAAAQAVEQILQRVREVREHERALRPGAVFCYFSGSAEVEHCRPEEPRQVFEGYNSTGRPTFSDFVTMSIERKDEGIDQLLAGAEVVLTHVTMGRVLRTQQLAEFGGESPVYKILGQVDAGLFRVLGAEQKCAFSFQLLRGTTLEGKPRLRLHSVGKVDLMDLADPGVLNILSRFQRRLDTESLRLMGKEQGGEVDDEAFVLPLLQDLAQKLQGRVRSTGRRTQHAVVRSDEGQRPTTK